MRLATARANEAGVRFETGDPVRFRFMRNTEGAPRPPPGDPYQQRIEPAGAYLLHDTARLSLPRRWVGGVASFRSPLVIPFGPGYGDESWKANLTRAFRGRGRVLSEKIRRAGYDAIVTVRDGETREIIALDPRTQLLFD